MIPTRGLYYKTFTTVNYGLPYKTRVFVPGKPFQSSLKFAGKAGAYPSEALERLAKDKH